MQTKKIEARVDRLTNTAQQMIGKMLPGLLNVEFCCKRHMVGSEFGVKMNSTFQADGGGVMLTFAHSIQTEHRLNAKVLSIVPVPCASLYDHSPTIF